MTPLLLSACVPSAKLSPVTNSVCGRYAPIILSDASFAALSHDEKKAIVDHNDKILADCP